MKNTAFALLGPTASENRGSPCSCPSKFPVEIVSVDSAQVYRGMDIGTAKPLPACLNAAPCRTT